MILKEVRVVIYDEGSGELIDEETVYSEVLGDLVCANCQEILTMNSEDMMGSTCMQCNGEAC